MSLDIKEPQVLVHYPLDANALYWHHRVLVHKVGPGRWVCITPDLELQVHDLATLEHKVLDRRAPFPPAQEPYVYAFDELSRMQVEQLRRRALTMSTILDGEAAGVVELQQWYIAEVGHPLFATVVSEADMAHAVTLGEKGVFEVEGSETYIKRLATPQVEAWVKELKGQQGDLRLLGDHRDGGGKRVLSLTNAISLMRPTVFADWSLSGPKCTLEFLTSIRDAVGELVPYSLQWSKLSGVNEFSAAAHEHRILLETIRLAVSVDQLDIANLLSFENIVRRIVQIECAVARNPAHPDFTGLELILEEAVDGSGKASVLKFNEWVSGRMKERAGVQKAARLYKEEFGAAAGGSSGSGHPKPSHEKPQPGSKKQPKKKGKGAGKGDGPAAEGGSPP
jgi:hypothetical protein